MGFLSQIQDSIDILEEFRKAIIESNIVLDEIVAGINRSRMGGQNIEFLDYRDYVYGDDLRYVDWKVFGKSDRYFIKRFDDNKRNTIYLCVDSSSSMNLGDGRENKYLRAILLVAVVANVFLRMQDDVYIITDGDIIRVGESYGNPLLEAISHLFQNYNPVSGDFIDLYRSILNYIKKNSTICLFSDLFSNPDKVIEYIKVISGAGVYQYIFHTVLTEEIQPGLRGLRLFEDPDSEDRLIIQADNIWDDYRNVLNLYISEIEEILKTTGMGKYVICDEKSSMREIILRFLAK